MIADSQVAHVPLVRIPGDILRDPLFAQVEHTDSRYPEAMDAFLDLRITDTAKRKILWDNCARFYAVDDVPASDRPQLAGESAQFVDSTVPSRTDDHHAQPMGRQSRFNVPGLCVEHSIACSLLRAGLLVSGWGLDEHADLG